MLEKSTRKVWTYFYMNLNPIKLVSVAAESCSIRLLAVGNFNPVLKASTPKCSDFRFLASICFVVDPETEDPAMFGAQTFMECCGDIYTAPQCCLKSNSRWVHMVRY